MQKFNKELFKDLKILYVEDDPMTVEEISFFLKKYVKKLFVANNGEEGLKLYKEHNPDMIISDIQMPIMNGLEMSEKIFKINPSIPIALTTAYSDSTYLMKAIELGIDKYIIKPINMLEILAVIQKSLNLESNQKEVYYEDYIQFILDSNPTFMFIMHSNELEYANKRFLDLMGQENVISLKEQIKSCENLFEIYGHEDEKNWLEFILSSKEEKHLVQLKDQKSNKYLKMDFFVTYKHFESTNKSVFVFVDANEEKLNKIYELTSNLIESQKSNTVIIDELREIQKISKKVFYEKS